MSTLPYFIAAELACPETEKKARTTVQFRWSCPRGDDIEEFNIGDNVRFAENMNSIWVRESYRCPACIEQKGDNAPHTEYTHYAFINVRKGTLVEVISEKDFEKRGLKEFIDANELAKW